MENRNSENIEEHHIPDTLERQLEALMSEEKNYGLGKTKKRGRSKMATD